MQMSLKETVERFLFDEAEMLDRWELADWQRLLTDDAEYLIPPIGLSEAESMTADNTLFVIADNRAGIDARITRMSGKANWAESPRSNLRRIVGNVRVLEDTGTEVSASANFCVWRIRRGDITEYIGQYRYRLLREGDSFRIRRKTVLLDIDVLRGQGGVGVIL